MPQTQPGATKSRWLQQLQGLAAAYRKEKVAETSLIAKKEEVQKAVEKERRKVDKLANSFASKVEQGATVSEKLRIQAELQRKGQNIKKTDLPAKHGDADARAIEGVLRKREAARQKG